MIRSTHLKTFIALLFIWALASCTNESKVFIGEWQDAREPLNKWSISKDGNTFKGARTGAKDFYKYDSEEWTYEIGEGGFPTLSPVTEGGSTIIYQPKQNRILRNPPGRAYVKVEKEK